MKPVPVRRHVRHLNRRIGWHGNVKTSELKGSQERRENAFSPEQLRRLSRVDYVELPFSGWVYDGFSCQNCRFFDGKGACRNPAINSPVLPNGCCNAFTNNKERFRARKAFEQ